MPRLFRQSARSGMVLATTLLIASCAGRPASTDDFAQAEDREPVNTGLAQFLTPETPDDPTQGIDEMHATDTRTTAEQPTNTTRAGLNAPISTDELALLIDQSTKDIEAALQADAENKISLASGQQTPAGTPAQNRALEQDQNTSSENQPAAAHSPELTEAIASLGSGTAPSWLRAFSTAMVGPLNTTGSERRRANRLADRASLMATQMLMPAIDEADEVTLEEQIADLAEQLAALLRDQASGAADPGQVYLVMAALEAIRPGVLSELAEEGAGELGAILSPTEIEAVRAARALAAGLADDEDAGDPNALADLLDEVATGLRPHTDIKISETALCRRVVGFGQYTPLASHTFVAGRSSRIIVYTELDRFAHRPVTRRDNAEDGEKWAIEVAQSVTMFVSRGDRQPVWHEPEQRVLQTSRRQIHDLYLVQMISLPPNLGVGSYDLRIFVRDLVGNSVDERVLPIRVVADAELARRAS